MVLNAGSLNRHIQIRHFVEGGRSSLNEPVGDWQNLGTPIFARRRDVSDGERLSAGTFDNRLVTRFVIRSTAFGRSITRDHRLVHDGYTFAIDGIKEVPDSRAFLEITALTGETP